MEDIGGEGNSAREPGLDFSRPGESFVDTVRRVAFEPAEFFSQITDEDRAWPPIAFAVICGIVATVSGLAVEFLVPVDFGPLSGSTSGLPEALTLQSDGVTILVTSLVIVVLSPLLILVGLYIGALIYHLLVTLIVGSEDNAGFWVTFKIYAYTSVVSLLSWIPVLGVLVSLYGYYLAFVAVREGHSTTTARAAVVAGITLLFFLSSLAAGAFTAIFATG